MAKVLTFLHCKTCLDELPDGESPSSYARLDIAVTDEGNILVWCNRHKMEVVTISPPMLAQLVNQQCEACAAQEAADADPDA